MQDPIHKPGSVAIVMNGKAEDRWLIGDYYPGNQNVRAAYAARRWIKKHARWSGTAYLIGASRIVRIEFSVDG